MESGWLCCGLTFMSHTSAQPWKKKGRQFEGGSGGGGMGTYAFGAFVVTDWVILLCCERGESGLCLGEQLSSMQSASELVFFHFCGETYEVDAGGICSIVFAAGGAFLGLDSAYVSRLLYLWRFPYSIHDWNVGLFGNVLVSALGTVEGVSGGSSVPSRRDICDSAQKEQECKYRSRQSPRVLAGKHQW